MLGLPVIAATVRMGVAVAQSRSAASHQARGVIKSFGPNRTFVNIAHERIEGYMEAMTMSFEPRTSDQLANVQVGDAVHFSFTESEDGRRWIDVLKKAP